MVLFGGEWKIGELWWLGRSAAVLVGLALGWMLARRRYSVEQTVIGAIIWVLSLVLMGYYLHLVSPDPQGEVQNILAGNVLPDFRFRPLVPWMALAMTRISGLSLAYTGVIVMYLWLLAALTALWFWFSLWMKQEGALLGIFLTAAVLPTTFCYWKCNEFSELALFTAGYLLLAQYPRKLMVLSAVFLAAILNKETGIFLLWPYFLVTWIRGDRRKAVVMTMLGILLTGGVYITLGIIRGQQFTYHFDGWLNWPAFCRGLWNFVFHPGHRLNMYIVAGGLWPLALWRFKTSPRFLRLSLTTIVLVLVIGMPFAFFAETRVFNPVLPVILALILWQIAPSLRGQDIPTLPHEELSSSPPESDRTEPIRSI
jgi:hypothetical protein